MLIKISAITQNSTSKALQRALEAQPGGKDGRWSANDEAAAMGGVIDFLQKYMKRGGRIQVDGKEKMKGQAARLALTAMDFANKCGGLTLSLHGGVVAEDDAEDTSQEEDAAATAAVAGTVATGAATGTGATRSAATIPRGGAPAAPTADSNTSTTKTSTVDASRHRTTCLLDLSIQYYNL